MAPAISPGPASEAALTEYTRLHITPLNPTLLTAVIPPSVIGSAQNISYHTLQAFPEKAYGFVELPKMDAEKIKKKLHGSILRGAKMKIEEAHPSRKGGVERTEETFAPEKKEKAEKSLKKRKRQEIVLPGAELHGRQVKRGWTDPNAHRRSETRTKEKKDKKDKKERVKSKFTSGPECLFRTTIPLNAAHAGEEDVPATKTKTDRRKKNKAGKETIVHEFAKTTKYATFLRDTAVSDKKKATKEYVEGEGWVNEDGALVEMPVPKRNSKSIQAISEPGTDDESSVLEEDSDSESDEEAIARQLRMPTEADFTRRSTRQESSTSSSGSSSDSSLDFEPEPESQNIPKAEDSTNISDTAATSRPSSSHAANLSIKIPPPVTAPETSVHPLEALYKRRQPTATSPKLPHPTPFSFFGADADEDGDIEREQADTVMPMTPFTQMDFAHRGQRSAAPTPDTAFPGGKSYFNWPLDTPSARTRSRMSEAADLEGDMDDDMMDAEENDETSAQKIKGKGGEEKAGEKGGADQTDFQKWFYENRGETNRAWKKRRKTAAKEKRQKENRKRGEQRT